MPERMIDRLSKEQLDALLNALPIELIFVDEKDRLQYCNKVERQERMRNGETLGRDVRTCHKPESLPRTEQMLDDLRSGRRDEDAFWIDGVGVKLLNRFLAVRDESGKYLGCIEYLLNFTALEELAKANEGAHRFVSSSEGSRRREQLSLGVSSLAKLLVVFLLLAMGAYAAYRHAWYAGPDFLDRCDPQRSPTLETFLSQIVPFLQRFHDPRAEFDPHDLRGHFSTRPGGNTDLYGSADVAYRVVDPGRARKPHHRGGTPGVGVGDPVVPGSAHRPLRPGRGRQRERDPRHRLRHGGARTAGLPPAPSPRVGRGAVRQPGGHSPLGRLLSVVADLDGLSRAGSGRRADRCAARDSISRRSGPSGRCWRLTERLDDETGFWKNGPLDGIWRRPTTIDLGGAAHFWWIYHHLGQPIPHPEKAVAGILALQRKTGLWGTRLFNGAYPQGIDFDALNGLRLAWMQLSEEARSEWRSRILAALDRYACAANAHLDAEGSVERLFQTPHKLVGTLNALAELDLLYRTIAGRPKLETPTRLRSALTRVAWQ